jgi:transposase
MAEVDAEGGRVLMVARRHGISKSLLYNWRSAWKAAKRAALPAAEFVQLGVVTDPSDQSLAMPMATDALGPRGLALAERAEVIEIDLPDGIRVRLDSTVNEKALRRVLSALRATG